MHVLNVAQRQ